MLLTDALPSRRLRHEEYTVAWLCALSSELTAARLLLDEQHEQLERSENDSNNYVLGHMGGHNIVIAFLGRGGYGTNAAANTATNIVRTFPNIRFGLLVGIGGGAPQPPHRRNPQKDLRLGDVVVSSPKDNFGEFLSCMWETSPPLMLI